jgi:hypothetical protein
MTDHSNDYGRRCLVRLGTFFSSVKVSSGKRFEEIIFQKKPNIERRKILQAI